MEEHICGQCAHHQRLIDSLMQSMPDPRILGAVADLLGLFGDTTRVRILFELLDTELCVGEIAERLQHDAHHGDLFVLGDIAAGVLGHLASTADPQTGTSGAQPQRGENSVLLFGGCPCENDPLPCARACDGIDRRTAKTDRRLSYVEKEPVCCRRIAGLLPAAHFRGMQWQR